MTKLQKTYVLSTLLDKNGYSYYDERVMQEYDLHKYKEKYAEAVEKYFQLADDEKQKHDDLLVEEMEKLYKNLSFLQKDEDLYLIHYLQDELLEHVGETYPYAGFKTHIPISPAHPKYLDVVKLVIKACDELNEKNNPTTLKISTPILFQHGYHMNRGKHITIYPNTTGTQTGELPINVEETFRISEIIGKKLQALIPGYDEINIEGDLKLPSGTWERFVKLDLDPKSLGQIVRFMSKEKNISVPDEVISVISQRINAK